MLYFIFLSCSTLKIQNGQILEPSSDAEENTVIQFDSDDSGTPILSEEEQIFTIAPSFIDAQVYKD